MANIKGRPEIPVGYFHENGDAEKTRTAARASYTPSLSSLIINKFARLEHPRLAPFVKGMRSLDLLLRQAVNQRCLNSARDRFNALDSRDDATAEGLQDDLRKTGYAPLTGLRDTLHESLQRRNLVSPEGGHRLKIHSDRRMIPSAVSARFERGSSGSTRAIRSTLQHALVGVYSAELSIKGLAGSSRLDKIARFAIGVSQLLACASKTIHPAVAKGTYTKMENSADKGQHTVTARGSIWQGKLSETLKGDKAHELVNKSFPQQTDAQVHNLKQREAKDDDDLYS